MALPDSPLAPQPLAVAVDGETVVIRLAVPASLPFFVDHFARYPMLPGVLQLGWAVQLAQRHFGIAEPFAAVTQLKFQHPITPEAELSLQLRPERGGRIAFAYAVPSGPCSAGRLAFGRAA